MTTHAQPMSTGAVEQGPRNVAHAFAELMNAHDPDGVDAFVAEGYINHNFFGTGEWRLIQAHLRHANTREQPYMRPALWRER